MSTASTIWEKIMELQLTESELKILSTMLSDELTARREGRKPFSRAVKPAGNVKRIWDTCIAGKMNVSELTRLSAASRGEITNRTRLGWKPFAAPQFPKMRSAINQPQLSRRLGEIRRV